MGKVIQELCVHNFEFYDGDNNIEGLLSISVRQWNPLSRLRYLKASHNRRAGRSKNSPTPQT